MTLRIYNMLAEIGDKVGSPIEEFAFLFIIAIVPGILILLAGKIHRVSGCIFLACFAALLAVRWQDAKFMLWDIFDHDLIPLAHNELGSAWIWNMRLASWFGLLLGLSLPSLLGNSKLPFRNYQALKKFNQCLCGYSLEGLTTNTCPECGRTIPATKP